MYCNVFVWLSIPLAFVLLFIWLLWYFLHSTAQILIVTPRNGMVSSRSSEGLTAANAVKSSKSYTILSPPAMKKGKSRVAGVSYKSSAKYGPTEAPIDRTMLVTPLAAERSDG